MYTKTLAAQTSCIFNKHLSKLNAKTDFLQCIDSSSMSHSLFTLLLNVSKCHAKKIGFYRASQVSPDECVDFGDIDIVQLLDSMFNLMFVCLDIHNEYKCVVVFNFLHSRLCRQGELDDGIVIQPKETCFVSSLHFSILIHSTLNTRYFDFSASVNISWNHSFHTLIAITIICTRFIHFVSIHFM